MRAVVIAGGLGTRLHPLTSTVPKPLLTLCGTPILRILLLQLRAAGCRRVILSLGYKPELFEAHFGSGADMGLELTYSRETEPLGTAGPLSLLESSAESTLVVNADILTNLNFAEVGATHQSSEAAATVVLRRHAVEIDYGVVEMDELQRVTDYKEKPEFDVLVGCGIYVLEPEAWSYLPTGVRMSMPYLLQSLQNDGQLVRGFLFEGEWIDVGTVERLRQAEEAFRVNRSLYLQHPLDNFPPRSRQLGDTRRQP